MGCECGKHKCSHEPPARFYAFVGLALFIIVIALVFKLWLLVLFAIIPGYYGYKVGKDFKNSSP